MSKNNNNYFEVFDWLSKRISKKDSFIIEAGTALSLCSRCHSTLKYGDFGANFINEIEDEKVLDYKAFADKFEILLDKNKIPDSFNSNEGEMFKLPIRRLEKHEYIFYTEEHFIHFYNALTVDSFLDQKQDVHIQLDNIEVETTESASFRLVEIGDVVTIKYQDSGKVIMVEITKNGMRSNYKSLKDIKGIGSKTKFGKSLLGRKKGEIFKMGKFEIRIENIEYL